MIPSPSGSGDAQPSFGSGGRPSSFSLGHLSASPMIPSPSGSVVLHPSAGSGGSPSSFSFRHLSVPSSGMPSPSASGFVSTGTGLGGSGGRQPDAAMANMASIRNRRARRTSMGRRLSRARPAPANGWSLYSRDRELGTRGRAGGSPRSPSVGKRAPEFGFFTAYF